MHRQGEDRKVKEKRRKRRPRRSWNRNRNRNRNRSRGKEEKEVVVDGRGGERVKEKPYLSDLIFVPPA